MFRYLEPHNSHGVRARVSLASPCAPKISETPRSSTAMTGHHYSNLRAANAARRREAPPSPPFPGRLRIWSKRRRFGSKAWKQSRYGCGCACYNNSRSRFSKRKSGFNEKKNYK